MESRPLDQLGDLQRAVLDAVWARAPVTVQQVVDALEDRRPAYTTILTTLQKLEKLGWVEHRRRGRVYVYSATRSRDAAQSGSVRSLIDKIFHGDPRLLMESLLDDQAVSLEEVDAIRAMIERKRKEREDD